MGIPGAIIPVIQAIIEQYATNTLVHFWYETYPMQQVGTFWGPFLRIYPRTAI